MSDDNVVFLETNLDLPPERILNGALEADLQTVLVIGWDKDERLFAGGSTANVAENLLLIEKFKQWLLSDG